MTERTDKYRRKAVECEKAAQIAVDNAVRNIYLDLAHQWQELAWRIEMLEWERPKP